MFCAMRRAYRDLTRGQSLVTAIRTHGASVVRDVLRTWGPDLLALQDTLDRSVLTRLV
jgi:hypothetical protein